MMPMQQQSPHNNPFYTPHTTNYNASPMCVRFTPSTYNNATTNYCITTSNFWFRQERCQVTKYIHKLYYITNKKKPIFTFEKVGGSFLCTVEICERKYTGTKESTWYSCTRLILV